MDHENSHTKTHIFAISFIFFLIAIIIGGGLYLLWNTFTTPTISSEAKNQQLVQPYNKRFTFEGYTLLPNFQNGQYESRVVVNGQTYPPMTSPGLRWNPSAKIIVTPNGNTTFQYLLAEGQGIQYTIYDISTQAIISSVSYSINANDISSANIIYLCDSAIVSDLQFVSNFQYRFDETWYVGTCGTQSYVVLSWDAPGNDVVTDDHISCPNPPTTNTTPYTYNSTGLTPNNVGWKGAWVGMTWYVNLGSGEGNIGSVKLLSPSNPILVIAPGSLTMSSS